MDKKKLAVIHIVKKELSLSDGEYRNILERITGVRSAKDLTDNQFHKLMRYFVRTRHYRVTNRIIFTNIFITESSKPIPGMTPAI